MRLRADPTSPYESGTWGTPDNPCPSERTLAAHLDGELDDARSRAVDAHLDTCDACASDARRLEGLSDCLKSWARRDDAIVPPPRLAVRVLREVSPEGGALRDEVARARRRAWAALVAATLVVGLGATLGLLARGGETSAPAQAVAVAATSGDATPIADRGPALAVAPAAAFEVPAPRLDAAVAALDRRASADAGDAAAFADPAARAAFAAWAPYADAQARVGEAVCVLDGRAVLSAARPEFERLRRWTAWLAERERLADDPRTRDPSAPGLAVTELFRLDGGPAALAGAARAGADATGTRGALVLRALPVRAPDAASKATDLVAAVRAGRVRLLPDADLARDVVVLEVSPGEEPVVVPAGELVSGGAGDRAVAEGAWLPAATAPYVVRLPARPVSPRVGRVGVAPVVVGRLAGPAVRALLARGDGADAVLATVHGLLADAGLLPPEGEDEPGLLALHGADAGEVERTARAMVDALGADARGFVASDAAGRFEGLEGVDVAGPASHELLVRLVAGYLAEARARAGGDVARAGVRADEVLGAFASRPPRLLADDGPASRMPVTPDALGVRAATGWRGVEPATGVVLSGVRAGDRKAPLVSALLRDFLR